MTITKETAIELAKEAGIQTYLTPLGTDEMHGRPDEIRRLCNLAIKHAQKDAEQIDEEYYPLLDHIRDNIVEFTALTKQERLAWIFAYLEKQ